MLTEVALAASGYTAGRTAPDAKATQIHTESPIKTIYSSFHVVSLFEPLPVFPKILSALLTAK
jgi:hypothetical protein